MDKQIRAIVVDIANTIENVSTSRLRQIEASSLIVQELARIGVHISMNEDEFRTLLRVRFRELDCWRLVTMTEPTPTIIWRSWLLPEYESLISAESAEYLTSLWMGKWYERIFLPDAAGVLKELKERGYRLGCISNTLSATYSRSTLVKFQVAHLFDVVALSSECKFRKPHPYMFDEVALQLDMPKNQLCYVGDQVSKDVVGAIHAGYGCTVLIGSETDYTPNDDISIWPDINISELNQLLDYFSSST